MVNKIDIDNIVNYYLDKLIAQYQSKPKAVAMLDLMIRGLIGDGIFLDIAKAYDVDAAIGAQLDTIGKIVGIDRNFANIIIKPGIYFAAVNDIISTPNEQYLGATNTLQSGKICNASDIVASNLLPDDTYRIAIKYKIILNNINMSDAQISQALYDFFEKDIIMISNDDMTITYFIKDSLSQVAQVIIQKKLLPKPIGVKVNTVIKKYNIPYFVAVNNIVDIKNIDTTFTAGATQYLTAGKIFDKDDLIYG